MLGVLCVVYVYVMYSDNTAQFHVYLLRPSLWLTPAPHFPRYFLDIVVVNQGRVSAELYYNNGHTIKSSLYFYIAISYIITMSSIRNTSTGHLFTLAEG